jgi:glycosyltransferase involved in cell wall biosynthesis
MRQKSCVLVGNFDFNGESPNGQSVKTQQIFELLRILGIKAKCLDTANPSNFFLKIGAIFFKKNIVLVPGVRAISVLWPFLLIHRFIFRKKGLRILVAVGGWLPSAYEKSFSVRTITNNCDATLVQTWRMKRELDRYGMDVRVIPNSRQLFPAKKRSFLVGHRIHFLFLSRVRLDKGIGRAVAVMFALRSAGIDANLSVYGPIENEVSDQVAALLDHDGVSYKGAIFGADAVQEVMTNHDILLFPTTYAGEGIPGVLVEALFAGLPVIATDWLDLAEIVEDGKTGFLFPVETFVEEAVQRICSLDENQLQRLSDNCLAKAIEFQPEAAAAVFREVLRS